MNYYSLKYNFTSFTVCISFLVIFFLFNSSAKAEIMGPDETNRLVNEAINDALQNGNDNIKRNIKSMRNTEPKRMMYFLGMSYMDGVAGLTKNFYFAQALYKKLAENGYSHGMMMYAVCSHTFMDIDCPYKDNYEACKYLELYKIHGDTNSGETNAGLELVCMTGEHDKEKMKREVANWTPASLSDSTSTSNNDKLEDSIYD